MSEFSPVSSFCFRLAPGVGHQPSRGEACPLPQDATSLCGVQQRRRRRIVPPHGVLSTNKFATGERRQLVCGSFQSGNGQKREALTISKERAGSLLCREPAPKRGQRWQEWQTLPVKKSGLPGSRRGASESRSLAVVTRGHGHGHAPRRRYPSARPPRPKNRPATVGHRLHTPANA